jgi:serine/threonine protein kinase
MAISLLLLKGVGKASLPLLTGGTSSLVEIGSAVAVEVWEWWGKRMQEKERRAELESLAQATATELRKAVKEVVGEVAGGASAADKSRLESYLMAVPAQIRRTLRRPADNQGRTIPKDLSLSRQEDLVPLLPPRPPRFAAGDRAADFELVELLGLGGFGEVWKARNAFMPESAPVALKFCIDAEAAASLKRETTLLDRIQREGKHVGIVQLQHTFLSATPPFLEYELVEGGDLGGLIVEWHRERGGPSPEQAARIVRRLAQIVAFAHGKGIIHRDLKPANILVQRVGEGTRIKVADFGIGAISSGTAVRAARTMGAASTRSAAAACGGYSLYYASPEQVRGTAPADPRDDVHAIGVIWYQFLVGDLSAEAPRGPGWKKRLGAKGMSAEMIDLLEACMATDREDRPENATTVAAKLDQLLKGGSANEAQPEVLELPPPPPPPPPRAEGSVLPAGTLGKVAGTVTERVRQKEREKREKNFVDRLRLLLASLEASMNKHMSQRDLRVMIFTALMLSGCMVGVGISIVNAIVPTRNLSSNNDLARRIATAHSGEDFTLSAKVQKHSYSYYSNSDSHEKGLPYEVRISGDKGDLIINVNVKYLEAVVLSNSTSYYSTYSKPSDFFIASSSDPNGGKTTSGTALASKLNRALAEVATEYNEKADSVNSASTTTEVFAALITAGIALSLVWVVRSYLRKMRANNLADTIDDTIEHLETEYPVDMAAYGKGIDLRDPDVVRELVNELERHMETK